MAALTQAIQNTTKEYLKSFVDASQTKDIGIVSSCLTKDCRRYIGPPYFLRQLGAPANLSLSNSEYETEFGQMQFYTFDKHELYDLTIDVPNLKAAARSELTGTFIDGKELSRTFVWFLDFNEDGSKIVKVYQHNDVQEATSFRQTIKTYHEANNQTSTQIEFET